MTNKSILYDNIIFSYYERKFNEAWKEFSAKLNQKYGVSGVLSASDAKYLTEMEEKAINAINTQLTALKDIYTQFPPKLSKTLFQPTDLDVKWLDVVENLKAILTIRTGINAFVKNNTRAIRAAFIMRQFDPGVLISKFGTGADGVRAVVNEEGEFLDTKGNVIPPDKLIESLDNMDKNDDNLLKLKLVNGNIEFKSTETDDLETDIADNLLEGGALFNKKKSIRKNHFTFRDKDLYDGFCFIVVDKHDERNFVVIYSFDDKIKTNLQEDLALLKDYFAFSSSLDTRTENENITALNNFNAFEFKLWMVDKDVKWNFIFHNKNNDIRNIRDKTLDDLLSEYFDKSREYLTRKIYPTIKSWAIKFNALAKSALGQISLNAGLSTADLTIDLVASDDFLRQIIHRISGFRFNEREIDLIVTNLKKWGSSELDELFEHKTQELSSENTAKKKKRAMMK